MLRWRSRSPQEPLVAGGPPQLTEEEVRKWRSFVAECNQRLATEDSRQALHGYVQRIRDAVIHRRVSVEEFLQAHPPPWSVEAAAPQRRRD